MLLVRVAVEPDHLPDHPEGLSELPTEDSTDPVVEGGDGEGLFVRGAIEGEVDLRGGRGLGDGRRRRGGRRGRRGGIGIIEHLAHRVARRKPQREQSMRHLGEGLLRHAPLLLIGVPTTTGEVSNHRDELLVIGKADLDPAGLGIPP